MQPPICSLEVFRRFQGSEANAAFYHHSSLVMKGLVTQSLVRPQWQGGTGYNNPIIPKNKSTVTFVPSEPEVGFVKRMMKRAGWFNTSKTLLVWPGEVELTPFQSHCFTEKFWKQYFGEVEVAIDMLSEHCSLVCIGRLREFKLSDTFLSWFLVTELHVWMVLVRLMAEGKDGRFARNVVVEAMWSDTNTRAKKLGVGSCGSFHRH
uniref:Ubiquinol-cytochrome c chaperone domain-containing protein n=1 Tax=Timema poppense TaxID=170557 RepID=A0A7R9CTH0_TIMPO|nr:unnamed protein product [Timema poppensis]